MQAGYGYETYKLLCEYHLFQPLFPTITRYFTENGDSPMERIIEQVLKNTDTRIHNDMRVNPAFLFAAMFWYPLLETAQKIAQESGLTYHDAFALAMNDVLDEACRSLAIPKRLTTLTRDIWQLQLRMSVVRVNAHGNCWSILSSVRHTTCWPYEPKLSVTLNCNVW